MRGGLTTAVFQLNQVCPRTVIPEYLDCIKHNQILENLCDGRLGLCQVIHNENGA